MRNAMHDALGQMAKFISTNSQSGSGLEGSIDELRNSVPELSAAGATGAAKTAAKPTSTPSTPTAGPTANGLIGEVVALYDQLQGLQQVSRLMQQTAHVRDAAMKLRSPLQATLQATIQQGQQMASASSSAPVQPAQPAAGQAKPGTQKPAQPDLERQQFDVLAARFKQIASATVPLSQEIILLDQS